MIVDRIRALMVVSARLVRPLCREIRLQKQDRCRGGSRALPGVMGCRGSGPQPLAPVRRGPTPTHSFAQFDRQPHTPSTMASVPSDAACRSGRIFWYSGES